MTTTASKDDPWQALKNDPIVLGGNPTPRSSIVLLVVWFTCAVFVFSWPLFLWQHVSFETRVFALVVLAVAGVFPYAAGFGVNRLTLDLTNRSLIREIGVHPFVYRRRSSLDEFDHLLMYVTVEERQTGHHGRSYTRHICHLQLVPKEEAGSPGKHWVDPVSINLESPMMPNYWAQNLADKIRLPLRGEPRG
jgi:hypothetical protein